MDLAGEYTIAASREEVWEALNDPEILKACIPGCQSLEKGENGELTATVVAKVGPVKATFKGEVRLENLNPPESYSIVGEGKGGVAGFAKGGADVLLTEKDNATVLTYKANAQVGGKLAQLGSRLIDSTAKKMADEFFGAFSKRVAGDSAATGEAAAGAAPGVETPAPASPAEAPSAPPVAPSPPAAQSAPGPARDEPSKGLSFSSPMMWLMIGAAALILVLALSQG